MVDRDRSDRGRRLGHQNVSSAPSRQSRPRSSNSYRLPRSRRSAAAAASSAEALIAPRLEMAAAVKAGRTRAVSKARRSSAEATRSFTVTRYIFLIAGLSAGFFSLGPLVSFNSTLTRVDPDSLPSGTQYIARLPGHLCGRSKRCPNRQRRSHANPVFGCRRYRMGMWLRGGYDALRQSAPDTLCHSSCRQRLTRRPMQWQ